VSFGYVPQLVKVCLASHAVSWQQPFALSECFSSNRNLSFLHLDFRAQMVSFYCNSTSASCLFISFCPCCFLLLFFMFWFFVLLQIWIHPEDPKQLAPLCRKLRVVHLYNIFAECDLNWTMFILESAPSLEDLCVSLYFSSSKSHLWFLYNLLVEMFPYI
jgi:hypothetical protein